MKFLFIYLLTICTYTYSQSLAGAIKVQDGILLCYNTEQPFSVIVEGDVNLSHYPYLQVDSTIIQITYRESKEFGTKPREILNNFMLWEITYRINTLLPEVEVQNGVKATENSYKQSFGVHNNIPYNFWEHKSLTEAHSTAIPTQYFLDFYHNNFIFRVAFVRFEGNSMEAQRYLWKLMNNFTFYGEQIDIDAIADAVKKGIPYQGKNIVSQ